MKCFSPVQIYFFLRPRHPYCRDAACRVCYLSIRRGGVMNADAACRVSTKGFFGGEPAVVETQRAASAILQQSSVPRLLSFNDPAGVGNKCRRGAPRLYKGIHWRRTCGCRDAARRVCYLSTIRQKGNDECRRGTPRLYKG